MEKKGQTITIVMIVGIIIAIGLITWQVTTIFNKESSNTTEQENSLTESETNETSQEETNEESNETDTNETTTQEEETPSGAIPNPIGSITSIDYQDDEIGEYFCNNTSVNNTINPEHKIKIYIYKTLEGTKNLSENYIESEKVTNICESYGNISMNYYIKWEWTPVEGAEGYRVYQDYYLNVNFSRSYTHYIDLQTEKLIDTGTDLWIRET